MPTARALAIPLLITALLAAVSASAVWAEEGLATWYGQPYHGRRMANGQVFDMYDPTTTASNRFPLGTWLRVTNPANGRSVEVQVRDRGAFSHALDLSYAAFAQLAPGGGSTLRVLFEVIPAPGQAPPAPPPASSPAAVAPPQARSTPPERPPSYTVVGGDTLASIARRFNLKPADLAEWNNLADPNLLKPGQSLRLAPPAPTPESRPDRYTVESGDTLASIARRFGLEPLELAAWNELAEPNLLRPGQALRLSPPTPAVSPAAPPAGEVYVVQPGDVLWQIAQRLGVDSHRLAAANQLGPDAVLLPGQTLVVPSDHLFHTVEPGDTLASIAAHYDTTVANLLGLNELPDPDLIGVGSRLRVR